MKQRIDLIPKFELFIRESESGLRRKKNGEKLSFGTIQSYSSSLKLLRKYCNETDFVLRVCDVRKLNNREFLVEKNYWKKFYKNFTNYLYKNGCHDNYVGANIKHLRTLLNYLKKDKNIDVGEFYKDLYVRKEALDILVLNPSQVQFLIHDKEFDQNLNFNQKKIKDAFVFGCTTGLRFSDISILTNKNFECQHGEWYVKIKAKKTKSFTKIKLPEYAFQIYRKHKKRSVKTPVFDLPCLDNFNKQLKKIGELAGWTNEIEHNREKLGKTFQVKKGSKVKTKFCDFMSSHIMRRTAITTMLILGMPEHLVRNISGHSSDSRSFYKYVHYSQSYLDLEINKVHDELSTYN